MKPEKVRNPTLTMKMLQVEKMPRAVEMAEEREECKTEGDK
jgi:hypothetical protein